MPCDSSYLAPRGDEIQFQRAARLYVWLLKQVHPNRVPKKAIAEAARDIYATDVEQVPALCALIKSMSSLQRTRFIYDGRNPKARKVADWWEEHQKADRAREREERARRRILKLRTSGLKKLSKAERRALGLGD